MDRVAALEHSARAFDLLVIGGGIIGAGIAEAATAHGLEVALVERGDFASATSSASSKLIHGGLRYLQMGDVRLVREAHQERRALMSVVAPHLVERLPFVFPLYPDGPHRPWFVRTGVLLYSALARAKLNGRVSEQRALRLVPQLRTEGLHSSALYADAWTNDGRLTLANVRGAADRGAAVLNYAEVTSRCERDGADVRRRRRDGARAGADRSSTRPARGSTGSGGSRIRRRRLDPALSKGVHLIVDGGEDWSAAVTIPHDKVRVSFAIPWEGKLLLGTTDTLHEGEPEDARVTDDDVRTILDEAAVAVHDIGAVRASFCGLRVLPGGPGVDRERAPRDRLHARRRTGMLSVAGGKLTTYRRIALDALEQLGVRNLDRRPRPLPGATGLAACLARRARRRRRAATCCISTARSRPRCSRRRCDDPSLLEPIVAGPPRPARAGALRARARVGAHRRGCLRARRTTAWLVGGLGLGHMARRYTRLTRAARS